MSFTTIVEFYLPDEPYPSTVVIPAAIPNLACGQSFMCEAPALVEVFDGKITSIRHFVSSDGDITTYVDVYCSYKIEVSIPEYEDGK